MSKYVENNLQNGEEIVLKAKINIIAAIGNIITAVIMLVLAIVVFVMGPKLVDAEEMGMVSAVIGIALILIGVIPLVMKIIDLYCTNIAVTNKRVIGKTGIIRVKSIDLHIEKVDTVKVETSFWGRLLKFYCISIKGTGDGEPIAFHGVTNGNEFKNAVNATIERHADEARKAQAAEIAAAMAKANNNNN